MLAYVTACHASFKPAYKFSHKMIITMTMPLIDLRIITSRRYVRNRYTWLPLLRLTPPAEGFPWEDLREIFSGCQWMAKVSNAV